MRFSERPLRQIVNEKCQWSILRYKLAAAAGNLPGGGSDVAPPAILDWEQGDKFSFEDSDRFEEDSLCSWSTEPESLCNNWRGWKRPSANSTTYFGSNSNKKQTAEDQFSVVPSLTELTAKCVASHIPFELVEHVFPPVPELLQQRIAFWSFPDNEEDIRLYSCLANGSADEFTRGENLFRNHMVKESLQIGFHLSADVLMQSPRGVHKVAITFDRRRISSCNCTCNSTAYWCSHVVAVCLTRIHRPDTVILRAPVSESLSRLKREQLQKFAQYLISELPQQILPTAQKILDELLGSQPSAINSVCGAPDPTAGASANDQTSWYLDEKALHDNIKKILIKFCVPAPIVFSDVNYLSNVAPPAAAEWTSLLRPLRGREPEGMWNLLSIVREMYKRNDRNAIPLLEIITEECMACDQILIWWFNTKVALLSGNSGYATSGGGKHNNVNSNTHATQHACSSLCDEVVVLWRLAALNPGLAPHERDMLHNRFTTWHMKILEKVGKCRSAVSTSASNKNSSLKIDSEVFTGFKAAIEACYLDWDDYPMPGITYTNDLNPMYRCPFTCFRHGAGDDENGGVTQINTSKAVLLNCEGHSAGHHNHHHNHHHGHHNHGHHHHHSARVMRFNFSKVISMNPVEYPLQTPPPPPRGNELERDGNRSSVSSEGFCENDDDVVNVSLLRQVRDSDRFDSDSQEGAGSDSSSSGDNSAAAPPHVTLAVVAGPSSKSDNITNPSTNWNNENAFSSNNSNKQLLVKDDSESPSGDEINVNVAASGGNGEMFSSIKKCDDPWDVLFARAEGLHAHGHNRDACTLGVKLAEELLANPPDLMIDIPPVPKRKGKKQQINPATHQLSCLASATLSKCAFLCSVLAENSEHSHLAFKVGMFGLQMARPPASTKPLEVKLANQEAELVNLLKRIPLGLRELQILRDLANQLKDSTLKTKGEAMLPLLLANFIFDSLVVPNFVGRERAKIMEIRLPSDEILGFEAAVNALGLKANVSEADHPLLCEGTRRQRGDLAIALLTFYKDDPWKVARIMDKLLDREIHQLLKTPILSSYYSNNPPIKSQFTNLRREESDKIMAPPSLNHYVSIVEVPQNNDPNCCSRPHSSTSAEIDQGMACLNMNNPSTSGGGVSNSAAQQCGGLNLNSSARNKEIRYKGKRAYPSIPNQPSEAGAHFMFELAKTVLNKAGGSSSTSLFTQPSTSQNHHGPNRALHMCAFQLGLYALGLHNCVSPNWLSRTYSSHVSWITGQAMEIGAAAISFLIDTWEGHLTPPEAVSMADRASRGCDPNMVRAAAELALSCLPHAHALNPNEIQRAILQCKEQSDDMLEHSCLTVENAAKGFGVYPEVLFQVAKYWYELYVRQTPGGEHIIENELAAHDLMDPHGALVALIDSGPPPPLETAQQTAAAAQAIVLPSPPNQQVVVTTAYQQHPLSPMGMSIPYVSHYNFLQHPAHHAHAALSYGGPLHPPSVPLHQPPPAHTVQMYQFPYPPPGNGAPFNPSAPPPPAPPSYSAGLPPPPPPQNAFPQYPMNTPPPPQQQPTNQGNYSAQPPPPNVGYGANGPAVAAPPVHPVQMPYYGAAAAAHIYPLPLAAQPPPPTQQQAAVIRAPHRPPQQLNQTQLRYLLAAYRVGMLALETLARRVHDDRPQAKYARNPPYGEDVKWLLRISKHLGTQYLHHFCVCVVNSIVSPFVLHEVAIEAAQYLSRNNPSLVMQHLRTALTPLVQKCQQMYIQCMHQKLYHLTSTDYEDFVSIVCAARAAFQITPEGGAQFKEWLQSIRRSKSCKKDLWAQINTALQANTK